MFRQCVVPEVAAGLHTKRLQQVSFQVRINIRAADLKVTLIFRAIFWINMSGQVSHHRLQVIVTLARIEKLLSGCEMQLQRFLARTKFLKPEMDPEFRTVT